MRRVLLPAIILALVSCDGATEPDQRVPLESNFEVVLGQAVLVEDAGIVIEFQEVPADSRCPPLAYCFWAGDAEVQLILRGTGEGESDVSLHTNPDIGPSTVIYGTYAVSMVDLEPGFSVAEFTLYVVTLRVSALAVSGPFGA
jgi:hypothetical protein